FRRVLFRSLDTDLWFTSFEANIGQEDTWWPSLPALPPRLTSADDLDALYDESFSKARNEQLKTSTAPWMSNTASNSNMHFGLDSQFGDEKNTEQNNSHNYVAHNYVVKEIIKLEQSRRMRSGELHYVDHPKLGLIIRIDNYKKAQIPESANSETR